MQDLSDFRIFFNGKLHRILRQFEQKRKNLLLAIIAVLLIVLPVSYYLFFSSNFALLLILPLFLWFANYYAGIKISAYTGEYKPILIREIIAYLKSDYKYEKDSFISRDIFVKSEIFSCEPSVYSGEDLIHGNIGPMRFEISELSVYHPSALKSKLEKIFEGIFFHATFSYDSKGRVLIVPIENWQRNTAAIKNIVRRGAVELEKTDNAGFDARFRVFYENSVKISELLSPQFLENMVGYHKSADKAIYASFVNREFFMAVSEKFNLLDSGILKSSLSFDKISTYYRDLKLYLQIVEDFEQSH